MKRTVRTAGIMTAAVLLLGGVDVADAHKGGRKLQGHSVCRQVWDRQHRPVIKRRRATICCWAERRGLSHKRVIRIARCESGRDLQDSYTADGYGGTFQQATRYWRSRSRHHGARRHSITDVWANAKVSTAMMKQTGYGQHWPYCGRI